MNDGAVFVAVVGVGVGMLAVLVPLLLTLGHRISDVVADVAEVHRNLAHRGNDHTRRRARPR